MTKLIVVYDACVLYPAPLRDLLMWLALSNLFQAKWTEKIHQEWMQNVLKNRPDLTFSQLNRTRELMNEHIDDSDQTSTNKLSLKFASTDKTMPKMKILLEGESSRFRGDTCFSVPNEQFVSWLVERSFDNGQGDGTKTR